MARDLTPAEVLNAVILHFRGEFGWGNDCCTSASDAYATLHGVDPMVSVRGLYKNYGTALRYVNKNMGFVAAARRCAMQSGLVARQRGQSRPGDLGAVPYRDSPFGYLLGICIEPGVWAVKSGSGFELKTTCRFSWGPKCLN